MNPTNLLISEFEQEIKQQLHQSWDFYEASLILLEHDKLFSAFDCLKKSATSLAKAFLFSMGAYDEGGKHPIFQLESLNKEKLLFSDEEIDILNTINVKKTHSFPKLEFKKFMRIFHAYRDVLNKSQDVVEKIIKQFLQTDMEKKKS